MSELEQHSGHPQEHAQLRRLWSEQQAHAAAGDLDTAPMGYVASHFELDNTLERQLRVLDALSPLVRGTVLEWGCHAALDSCVYRMRLADQVQLHGCDVYDAELYRPFYEFSGMRYTRLEHTWRLPYADAQFDTVTSNGVLEHVPEEERSLAEIARVLRPGGSLLIACLPNRYSYTELYHRRTGGPAHERRYTLGAASSMLQRHGFDVELATRSFMLPTMLSGFPPALKQIYERRQRLVWAANDALEHVWPLSVLASNLLLVGRLRRAPDAAAAPPQRRLPRP